MKKILKLMILPLILFAFSCEKDSVNVDTEFGWIQFNDTGQQHLIEDLIENQTATIDIPVQFTAPINKSDINVQYTIVNILGNASEVISSSGVLNIAADTNTGIIRLNINSSQLEANMMTDYSFDIVLSSTDRQGVSIGLSDGSYPTSFRVDLIAPCFTPNIGGMYSVTTVYGFHDFLASYPSNTMDMEIVDNGDGTYFIQDFSGGLYDGGPYTGAYGTGPTSFDVTISVSLCGNTIQWSDQNDPWGATIPLDGGVNEVDLDTGIVTISWFNEGYGENGVSVYTPL
jgi:hypothetical protein